MGMIVEACQRAVEALERAGIRATVEARDVNPPGAWIAPARVDSWDYCTGGAVHLDIILLAPDHGATIAIDTLEGMLEPALDALAEDDISVGTVDLRETATLSGQGPVPAFRITAQA